MVVFWTVISGVIVFSLSQYLLKVLLDPLVELRKVVGEISFELLASQAKITNNKNDSNQEIVPRLKKLAARLSAGVACLPFYHVTRHLGGLPSEEDAISVARALNGISANLQQTGEEKLGERCAENSRSIDEIGLKLKTRTTYRYDSKC